jgi:hypothetical protein
MPSANYRWNLSLGIWQITITLYGETPQIRLFYISNFVYVLFSSRVSSTPTHWTQQSLTLLQTQFSLSPLIQHKRFQKTVACHPQLLFVCETETFTEASVRADIPFGQTLTYFRIFAKGIISPLANHTPCFATGCRQNSVDESLSY